mmetsp:Transcript_154416/g.493873  ORF Transcript_154416/g.493873 Transcript_154416/m.493873 type:complete len:104 (+) Transcript_154416:134-445(+)
MAAKRSPLALLLLAAAAALLMCGPSFVPAAGVEVQTARAGLAAPWAAPAAAVALAAAPMAAQATVGMPAPVIGLGIMSIIVVIVLLVSGIVIFRGLVETIDDI